MKWYCTRDLSKYCDGTPEWETEPTQYTLSDGTPTMLSGGVCKLSPETCGRCKTSQQLWSETPEEEKERINKSTYVENVIPVEKPEKPEKEIAQGSMF